MPIIYDPTFVMLSVLVAIIGSLTGLVQTFGYESRSMIFAPKLLVRGAVAVGGSIWSMHFIAMLAVRFPVAVRYNVLQTLLSLAIAIVFTAIGLAIASAKTMGWSRIPLAGLIMGSGIAGMHYLGMNAIRGCGSTYDFDGVALSISMAMGASGIALWFAFRRRSPSQTLIGGTLLGLAITSMHYTGMYATTFFPVSAALDAGLQPLSQTAMALAVATLVICGAFGFLFASVLQTTSERQQLLEVKGVLHRLQRLDLPHEPDAGKSLRPGAARRGVADSNKIPLETASATKKASRWHVLLLAAGGVSAGLLLFFSYQPPALLSEAPRVLEVAGNSDLAARQADAKESPTLAGSDSAANEAAAKAYHMIQDGHIAAARKLLLEPGVAASQQGAWLLARSYDPNYLASILAPDVDSDKELAAHWYRQWREIAARDGVTMDDARLNRLITAMK